MRDHSGLIWKIRTAVSDRPQWVDTKKVNDLKKASGHRVRLPRGGPGGGGCMINNINNMNNMNKMNN